MNRESESMREIREIRNQIYEEIKDMNRSERLKYLKEEAGKARKLLKNRIVHN